MTLTSLKIQKEINIYSIPFLLQECLSLNIMTETLTFRWYSWEMMMVMSATAIFGVFCGEYWDDDIWFAAFDDGLCDVDFG